MITDLAALKTHVEMCSAIVLCISVCINCMMVMRISKHASTEIAYWHVFAPL